MEFSNKYKKFKELGIRGLAKLCEQELIEKGYIKTEAIGWVKPEDIERFGISPNELDAVPCEWTDEREEAEENSQWERDEFGNKKKVKSKKTIWVKTGRQVWRAKAKIIEYIDWKARKEKERLNNLF